MLQADGLEPANRNDRHVLLYWTKLSGGPGNYSFQTPAIISLTFLCAWPVHPDAARPYNRPCVQRPIQQENNCQAWMRLLLEAMVNSDLLSQAVFDRIAPDVPLLEPISEPLDSDATA